MTVQATVLGVREFESLVDGMRLRSADLRPAWAVIDKRLSVFFRLQFETSGQVGGAKWKPLAPATKRARVRPGGNRGGVDRPLWDTARFKRSMQTGSGPESVRVMDRQRYERGSSVPYSVYHPDRPVIPDPFPEHMMRAWLRHIEGHVFGSDGRVSPAAAT